MRNIPELDGLRGLAVAMVFMRHAAYMSGYQNSLMPSIATLMLNGWIGVDLFFILSGFLISRPFFSKNRDFTWRSYLSRRALRILPAYWFVLLFVVVGGIPFYAFERADLGFRVYYHLLFLQDYFSSDIVVAFWSLGVEEKFYLLAPALLPLIMKAPNVRVQFFILSGILLLGPLFRAITVKIVGLASNYPEFFLNYRSPFHACIDGLFWGVLLARIESCDSKWLTVNRAKAMFWLGGVSITGLMFSYNLLDHNSVAASVFRPTGIGLGMALLVGAAVFGGAPRLFAGRFPRWLGRISYSLYLIHIPLIYPADALTRFLGEGFMLFMLIYIVITLSVSHLMRVYVEQPFLNLKMRLLPH
ncbi:MAG: acyltransferase family protein [Methylomicrobium sp.]